MTLSLPINNMREFLEKENELYKSANLTNQKSYESAIIPLKLGNHYTVQSGDNLHNIARRHHISVQQLKTWNGLQTNFLIAGQSLVITDKENIALDESSLDESSNEAAGNHN